MIETAGSTPYSLVIRRTDLGAGSDVKMYNAGSVLNLTTALTITGALNGVTALSMSGNLSMSAANPAITSGGSYITVPNGLYVSGGTTYITGVLNARGGIGNDSGAGAPIIQMNNGLTITGALAGVTNLTATGTTTLNTTNISSGYILKGYSGPSSNIGPHFYTLGWGGQGRTIFTRNTRNDTYAQEGDILLDA